VKDRTTIAITTKTEVVNETTTISLQICKSSKMNPASTGW